MRKRAFTRLTSLVTQRSALAPLAAVLVLLSGQALAVSDMSRSIYAVELDPAELNAVQSLLPEQRVNSAFVNSAVDPNLRLLEAAEVSVTWTWTACRRARPRPAPSPRR